MRSKVELLKLLREELHSDTFCSGLCSSCQAMQDFHILTEGEHYELRYLIYENRPKDNCGAYFFPIGEREPRDKFLQELIEKYKHD